MDPSNPTPQDITYRKELLENMSNLDFFSMFTWRYGSDTYGFNDPWKDEMDIRELARRVNLDPEELMKKSGQA